MKPVRVGDIADQLRGVTFAKADASPTPIPGSVPVLTAGNIQDGRLVLDGLTYVPDAMVRDRQRVQKDDVVICASSGSLSVVGKAARSRGDFDGGFGAFLKVLRPGPAVDPGYFSHFFQTSAYRRRVSSMAAGANINNLKNEHLNDLEIPLPPLDEQRRIAAILDQADVLRAKRSQAVAHFETLTQSIFHDMFGGTSATTTVEAIATQIRTGPFGSQLLHSEFVDDGIAVLGLDNVVGNEFRWVERRYITPWKYEQLKRYTVRPGDVLISIMGTTGRCVVVPDSIPMAINTKHICAITADQGRLDSAFLRAAFLWHPESRAHLLRQTKGSIMDGLNMGIIKAMPIPVPPLDLQHEFARRAETVNLQLAAVHRARDADNELFVTLQARAFRGDL